MTQQDQEVLKAVYDERLTLRELADRLGCTYEQAEAALADALRSSKTRARWGGVRSHTSSDVPRQGNHFPGLAHDGQVRAVEAPPTTDFDDLDAWLYGEEE